MQRGKPTLQSQQRSSGSKCPYVYVYVCIKSTTNWLNENQELHWNCLRSNCDIAIMYYGYGSIDRPICSTRSFCRGCRLLAPRRRNRKSPSHFIIMFIVEHLFTSTIPVCSMAGSRQKTFCSLMEKGPPVSCVHWHHRNGLSLSRKPLFTSNELAGS